MTYLINLVLAVLCTLLLSSVNFASLYTLLHHLSGQDWSDGLMHAALQVAFYGCDW